MATLSVVLPPNGQVIAGTNKGDHRYVGQDPDVCTVQIPFKLNLYGDISSKRHTLFTDPLNFIRIDRPTYQYKPLLT